MQKIITNKALTDITDAAAEFANGMRDAAKKIENAKVENITDGWSRVAALQNLISAASELSGKILMRERIQQQQSDLAKLKASR